jgi:hypothetical protein
MGFFPSIAFHNFGFAIVKAPLFLLGLLCAALRKGERRSSLLAGAGLASAALMLVASAKSGAADNYFFEAAAVCAVVFLLQASERLVIAGAAAQVFAVLLILLGIAGRIVAKPLPELPALKGGLASLSGPIVVSEAWANVPWIQEHPPHFVFAATYGLDRSLGRPFAFDGIAGMIGSGRIRVVVCPQSKINQPFDGIVPSSLRKIRDDTHWAYFATEPGRSLAPP